MFTAKLIGIRIFYILIEQMVIDNETYLIENLYFIYISLYANFEAFSLNTFEMVYLIPSN